MERILVVEDSPEMATLLSLVLRMEGYEVTVANEGTQALQVASAQSPMLILMDVGLPGPDGFEVAQRLKKDAATRNIPVMFVTARVDVDDHVRGLELGVDYVVKPFAMPELLARVRNVVQRPLTSAP